jgi:P4 family phage/plasmid primase-like protien
VSGPTGTARESGEHVRTGVTGPYFFPIDPAAPCEASNDSALHVPQHDGNSHASPDPVAKSAPAPDRKHIAVFVLALFKHATAGNWVSLRAFPDKGENNSKPCKTTPVKLNGDLKVLIDQAYRDAELAASAYEKVVFCPPVATFDKPYHARVEDLAEGLELSVECDKAAATARVRLEALLGPATLVVESGGEWIDPKTDEVEPKLHLHFRLKVPTRQEAEHVLLTELRKLATLLVNGDKSNIPPTHPIRWPGSLHRKGNPKLCRIVARNPDAEIDLAWALTQLREAVEAAGFAAGGTHATGNGAKPPNKLRAPCIEAVASALAAIPNEALEWEEWNYIGMAVYGATAGSDEGGEAFAKWSKKSKKNNEATTAARWEHFHTSPPDRIGFGTLAWQARQHQPDWEYAPVTHEAVDDVAPTAPLHSEEALALSFAERHADTLRYVAKWGQWLIWDGTCWRTDETRRVFTLARELCREISKEANKPAERKRIASAKTRAAVVSLASEDRRLAATMEQWDVDPWLLNTPDGVVDLRTGRLRKHQPTEYMTMQTSVSPERGCPQWMAFLQEVTGDDVELQRYLQRVSGYCLTGMTTEQELYFLYGPGNNGKGVWTRSVAGVWGDYHRSASIETFTAAKFEQHPTELAKLRGARLVTASETEEGRRWAESRIKQLTGGDPIDARFMRQDFFTYTPQLKLLFQGNHMPKLRTINKAISRRFKRILFAIIIPDEKVDKHLEAKLKTEWSGILAWAIEGCLEWQRIGMCPPKVVTDATESYLESEDVLGEWLNECCVRDANAWENSTALFSSWKGWAVGRDEWIGSSTEFSKKLEDRGEFTKRKNVEQTKRGFGGVRLKTEAEKGTAEERAAGKGTFAMRTAAEDAAKLDKLLSPTPGE